MFNHQMLMKKQGGGFKYPSLIDYGAKFKRADGDTAYGTSPATATDTTKWTISFWVKKLLNGQYQSIASAYGSATYYNWVGFHINDSIIYQSNINGSTKINVTTDAVLRDPTQWYNIHVMCDTSQAIAADRFKIHMNNNLLTLTGTLPVLNQASTSPTLNTWIAAIGRFTQGTHHLDGYLAEMHCIDGQAVDPSEFGELKYNTWVHKPYTGTYGLTGCYHSFANPLDVFADDSGTGNDKTAYGSPAQTEDTPTNNYPTLDPIDTESTGTISDAGLTVAGGVAKPTMRPTSGLWYYEKDGVGVTYDADTNGEFNPDLSAGSYNFGAGPFSDTQPAGYKTICTANWPASEVPVIDSEKGLWINTRTGTGAIVDVTGTPFNPSTKGLVWTKNRDQADSHRLVDAVRGVTNELYSNASTAETVDANGLTAFLSNGFSLGTGAGGYNDVSEDFVDFVFNMLSQYGMDIVTYEGTGVVRTVAHNLGAAPELIIVKNRDAADNWMVYCAAIAADAETDYLIFNGQAAAADLSTPWNDTAPDASNFTVGTHAGVNTNAENYVAYLFRSIPGFLKVGYYIGNGAVNGPRIYTGFRPRYLLSKNVTSAYNWTLVDSVRATYNMIRTRLYSNDSAAEVYDGEYDFLSNGFKIRGTDNVENANGSRYIYLAIGDPYPYVNAF